ncbi:hypothetical protein [Flavobacterium sp. NRK1]|uniref:hypothetical protein n=1 Tax=Flavobacterium sp. NRK1 TaxID=2954929 RepID=UPI002093C784|nr:hypothetical protein [Flavobacterium sp. NRK1]MCO6148656.1 hypothetical protein [Flavobacterium sp. NRK1]
MASTKNPNLLPDIYNLQNICKAISVLDAILSQKWEFRYYSYNAKWDVGEHCFQMRNGLGDEMQILFLENGCVINGFAHEFELKDKIKITTNLNSIFNEFMFGEPVNSIGTTFCIWTTYYDKEQWKTGILNNFDDNSDKMLTILNADPKTYYDHIKEYFDTTIPLEIITKIYNGEKITKDIVLAINNNLNDWKQLEKDLNEIEYPYEFKSNWNLW